jgi:tetratricopeptide (TPR) repeat protein
MLSSLSGIFKDPDIRAVLAWFGSGIVVWAVVKFIAERNKSHEKKGGGTNVTQLGPGAASGRDINTGGHLILGADGKQIGQAVVEATKPLRDRLERLSARNAELARRLDQERKGPQTPGSERAVAEAIDATAKETAACNPRATEALALLNAGKIAEAVPLFEAEAAETEATGRQNAKQASAAYRNLGAIAGLADPKRALEAYEKALALDPDDLKSSFWASWIEINYGDFNEAQTRLERMLMLAETGDWVFYKDRAFYKYWALSGLGGINQQRGDLGGALKSHKDSLAIAERLVKSDPGNAEWQHGLLMSYARVGDVQIAQGDIKRAWKSYNGSLAIAERLVKSDPGNAEWQHGLSVSCARVGDVQMAQGDIKGVRKSYKDSLAIAERLATSDPGNAELQRDLSMAYDFVGNVQMAEGEFAGALKSYKDGLAIRERFATSDPGNAEWQRDLSVAYDFVGNVQKAEGDLAGALKSYMDSLAIRERFATSDPGNAGWQRDLSVSYNKVGDVLVAQGDLEGALKSYKDSLAIGDRLARISPGNVYRLRDLAANFAKLAHVYQLSGYSGTALRALRQGHEILSRVTKLSPDNARWKRDLAWFDGRIKELAP